MEANDLVTRLEAARTEAARLAAEVVTQKAALEEAQGRLKLTTSRGAFAKVHEDIEWTEHLIELGTKRLEEHRIGVLFPLESQHGQAIRDHEAQLVVAARLDAEKAFAAAGELTAKAVRAISAAVDTIALFDQVRGANPSGASIVSLAPLRVDAIVGGLNAKIGAQFVRYISTLGHAGGEIQLHVVYPIAIPPALR